MKLKFNLKVYSRLDLAVQFATNKNQIVTEATDSNIVAISANGNYQKTSELNALISVAQCVGLFPPDHDIVAITEIEDWLNICINSASSKLLSKLSSVKKFVVGNRLSIADVSIFATLFKQQLNQLPKHYFDFLVKESPILAKLAGVPCKTSQQTNAGALKARKREGKYIDLPGAEKGKVIVRFPPEASGYLHIGHAKAALLNQNYQQAFEGKLILRFDDTNPAKETGHFEDIILEDLKTLGVDYNTLTKTSDSFDKLIGFCEQLIKQGDAYVDNTDAETMRKEREARTNSKCRDQTIDQNFKLWDEMKKGSEIGLQCCVRAKIDMNCDNGCLRDPTLYRCKSEEHLVTGSKYKVYPTYDFACPIVDSIEQVTHALRTTEYHDRDEQYFWVLSKLGLRKPHIWSYSRLNLQHTVMSKRKLTWLVDNGYVSGWDDPRLPTVRGVFRRGMTVEGLKEFIVAQGSSTKVVTMDWSKIWAINKQVIDPIAPRYVAVLKENVVEVVIEGVIDSYKSHPKHPKNPDVGQKDVWYSNKLVFDQADAAAVKEGEVVTFVNWGNMIVKKIKKNNSLITTLECNTNLENTDYKNTQKFTWLASTKSAPLIPTVCVHFAPILLKPVLGKDDDFKENVNTNSLFKFDMLGEPGLANLKKGDIIQLMRRGYFIVDQSYSPPDANTSKAQPCVLFHIPDGHVKELPTAVTASSSTSTENKQKESAGSAMSSEVLNQKIVDQGNKIRKLKAEKAVKNIVDEEVKNLLAFKAEFKKVTGLDWSPSNAPITPAQTVSAESISQKIVDQGNKVRKVKSEKAAKDVIDAEVKILLALKADYKNATGKDWTPSNAPTTPAQTVSAESISQKIVDQGNKVRKVKSEKAAKDVIDAEVKILLALKADYKNATGKDWTPSAAPASKTTTSADDLNAKIVDQGNNIRRLKAEKADKGKIDSEVKALLSLKADYKSATGKDWSPSATPAAAAPSGNSGNDLNEKIAEQGDKIRKLKSEKAAKSVIDAEVQTLLALKADFKKATGRDWTPTATPKLTETKMTIADSNDPVAKLNEQITQQGNKVRQLKGEKADKATIDDAVKTLLSLKADYAKVAGKDWAPPAGGSVQQKRSEKPKSEQKKQEPKKQEPKQTSDKKVTRLGLEAKKEDDFAEWYTQLITKAELIEYYDVSGCYVLRPTSYAIWERIQSFFDAKIKTIGVENCYFPIFVSKAALEREKTHISDFAPEVAWVTKSGGSDLAEPIAIRPTSETVMYPAYARWVQSHRDLPINLNQWCSVVRWEFKNPQPFIRTREFLWQEGHSAFATAEEAHKEVFQILEFYAQVYEDLLAIPVIKGKKTVKERFAGADFTTTTELYIPTSGRGLQGATSHHLGQNFSKMFGIEFEDPNNPQQKLNAWQNSWGISTRSIGAVIMIHGDNNGLVLPPRVAMSQVVIVPVGITANTTEEKRSQLMSSAQELANTLNSAGIRTKTDLRENITPGWKFNHWELKGIPIRIELGPRELEKGDYVIVRRDTGEKSTHKIGEAVDTIKLTLEKIHGYLFEKAKKARESHTTTTSEWSEFVKALKIKNIILAPFCGEPDCEDTIKDESAKESQSADGTLSMGAKSLCIPLDEKPLPAGSRCINPNCNNPPKVGYTLFGRSY